MANANLLSNSIYSHWAKGNTFGFTPGQSKTVADAWRFTTSGSSANATVSQQNVIGAAGKYGVRIQRNASETAQLVGYFEHAFSTDEVAALRGQDLTAGVTLHKGADFGGDVYIYIVSGDGTQGTRRNSVFANEVTNITPTAIPAASINGSRHTITTYTPVSLSSASAPVTQLTLLIYVLSDNATAGADDWVQIEIPKLEQGTTATDHVANTDILRVGQQLLRVPVSVFVSGATSSSQQGAANIPFPARMLSTPACSVVAQPNTGVITSINVTADTPGAGRVDFLAGGTGYCYGLYGIVEFDASL